MKRLTILLLVLFITASCTRVKITGANFPSLFSDQVGNYDIEYGKKNWQKLDVYQPYNDNAKNPVIIFLYGGRWQFGSKDDYRFAADAFTERGYVVVIPDYVKYPEGKFPSFVEDGARAVAWTRENIWKYNGDIENINVIGHSAGAYIGGMISTNEDYLKAEGGNLNWIKSYTGLAGAYNFKPTELFTKEFSPILGSDFEPICLCNFISKRQPPVLLLWGEADTTIDKWQMDYFAEGIKTAGGKVQTKTYKNIDHVGIVAALSRVRRSRAPVIEDIDAFIKSAK